MSAKKTEMFVCVCGYSRNTSERYLKNTVNTFEFFFSFFHNQSMHMHII